MWWCYIILISEAAFMCYKVEQGLLQSGAGFLYCKAGQVVLHKRANKAVQIWLQKDPPNTK